MQALPSPGSFENPISRDGFNAAVLTELVTLDASRERVTGLKEQSTAFFSRKVAPTLVLYPPDDELTAGGAPGMRDEDGTPDGTWRRPKTLLKTKSGHHTFEEALMSIHGKALLLNFCSPSLEVYPKDSKDCHAIYGSGLDGLAADVVPDAALASDADLKAYLTQQLGRTVPAIEPMTEDKLDKVIEDMREDMKYYKKRLKRNEWRMARNKDNALVVACKLTRENVAGLLKLLRSDMSPDARLFREESYDPKYQFGAGDYVVIDLEPWEFKTLSYPLKRDKHDKVLVRTVNESAFEHTYGKVHRPF